MRHGFFRYFFQAPKFALVASIVFFIVSSVHAYDHECGTIKAISNILSNKKLGKASTRYSEQCAPEAFYDTVYTIETNHFQIFYVLKGPHATTKAFAESTATSMEKAWDFYINQHKMHAPQGVSTTIHYLKEPKEGLYPIEIVDLSRIRDSDYRCFKCFGLTVPYSKSQIFLDNDFKSPTSFSNEKDTTFFNGDTCTYDKATDELYNLTYDYSYADEWLKGIKVTAFHEFYHAIQLTYISMFDNETFWFEASAAGFEEITNPDIDDYIRYIPNLFKAMGTPLSDNFSNYGASTLFLYLYQKISKNLDRSIWENYSKNPTKNFEYQFEKALNELNLNADSIFHDYSVRLSFSGKRTTDIKEKEWINDDQSQWPNAIFRDNDEITPDLKSLAFDFYNTTNGEFTPNLTNFIGKASVIIYSNGKASIHKIQSTKTIDSLTSVLALSDSSTWIFSRLGDSENIPITNSNAAPHAFPVPWREGPLCFAPLPRDKKFIELRTRRGDLISQEKYEGTSYCLQEEQVKSMMAPGIYRFRVGNKGKTTSFMIIY